MLFEQKALGLEITHHGVKMVLAGGNTNALRLHAYDVAEFPLETLRISHRDHNILDPAAFVRGLHDLHIRMLTGVRRVSVSLPDSVGRVMLLDLETRFKNREEGADIIRWKLKKSLPIDISDIHLDYQILREKQSGEVSTLVSIVSRQILNQYEELIAEAGMEPNKIDFTTFGLYRLFSRRLDLADNFVFAFLSEGVVGILCFFEGALSFYRTKEIVGKSDLNRVFREINSSMMVYHERAPGHTLEQAFCFSSADSTEGFASVVAEATGLEPVTLETAQFVTLQPGIVPDRKSLSSLTAALGAAVRNL